MGVAITATSPTTMSVSREPWITRLRMSRARSSVPIGCAHEGGSSRSVRRSPPTIGSWGAIQGARIATAISASTRPSPTMASRLALSASQVR